MVSRSPGVMRVPRSRFRLFSLSTVVLKRRAMDESVSPRLTRYVNGPLDLGLLDVPFDVVTSR